MQKYQAPEYAQKTMVTAQDREVVESAPTRLSFWSNFFFYYINLIIVHKQLFLHLHKKKKTKR